MKVKYGLSNVYYAPITADAGTDGWPTYGTPQPWPGAVSISLEQQGSIAKFRADNRDYWQNAVNNGYEGEFESAMVPRGFLTDCIGGYEVDGNGAVVETNSPKSKAFALLFQMENDVSGTRFVFYNCTATRPSVEGKTTEEDIEPDPETVQISAAALANEKIKAFMDQEVNPTAYAGWFDAVYKPIPTSAT